MGSSATTSVLSGGTDVMLESNSVICPAVIGPGLELAMFKTLCIVMSDQRLMLLGVLTASAAGDPYGGKIAECFQSTRRVSVLSEIDV